MRVRYRQKVREDIDFCLNTAARGGGTIVSITLTREELEDLQLQCAHDYALTAVNPMEDLYRYRDVLIKVEPD